MSSGNHPDQRNDETEAVDDQNYDQDMDGSMGELMEDSFEDEEHSRCIPDFTYKIASSIDQNVVVHLSGGHNSSVHAWQYFDFGNQKWTFTYDTNKEAYKITCCKSPNLALTLLPQDNSAVGADFIDNDTQYWSIERTTDGFYKLRNLYDMSRVLDLAGGTTSNGNQIQLTKDNTDPVQTPSQKWMLTPIYYQTVRNGEYKISSCINQNVVADLSGGHQASVHAWQYLGLSNQKWNVTYNSNKEAYKITSCKSPNIALSMSLEDKGAVGANFIDNDSQYWRIERNIDGYYKLRNLYDTSQVLDLAGGITNNGSRIQLSEDSTNPAQMRHQKWMLTSISYQTIRNREYKISSSINQNVVADLSGGDLSSVHVWQYLGIDKQKWNFAYDSNRNAYKITSSKSPNLVLTWLLQDNRAVGSIFTDNDTQFWRIESTGDGFYKLRNLHDASQVLELAGCTTDNGNQIQLAGDSTNPDYMAKQKWALTRTDEAVARNGEYQISTSINRNKVIDFDENTNNLIISDNINSITSYWLLEYNATKKAYKIHTKKDKNTGFYFQDANFKVKVDNIDISDTSNLRPYWTVEYNVSKGGYLIRSLHDQTQVLDLEESNVTYGTPVINCMVTNNNNQLWNLIPK